MKPQRYTYSVSFTSKETGEWVVSFFTRSINSARKYAALLEATFSGVVIHKGGPGGIVVG